MTDNLTHSVFSFFLGIIVISMLRMKGKRLPIIAAIVAGNLPDIDFVFRAFGAAFYYTHHRVLTHSVFGILALAVMLAAVFSYLVKQKQFKKYFVLSLVLIIGHVFLDLITSFGTEVFFPFSNVRLTFSLIPLIDVYVLSIFAVGYWFIRYGGEDKVKVAKATLFIFLVFLLFKAGLNLYATQETAELKSFENVEVVPHFLNPFGWKAIVAEPDYYLIADFDLSVGGFKQFKFYPMTEKDKIEASKKAFFVRQFLEFSKAPYPIVKGNVVKWVDLRVSEGKFIGLSAEAELDDGLNVVDERFGI